MNGDLLAVGAIVAAGLALVVRGYFGSSAVARRWAVVAILASFLVGLTGSAIRWAWAGTLVSRLGPAATPTDVARAYNAALLPVGVGLGGAAVVAILAAIGWALSPERAAGLDPRKPAR